MKRQFVILLYFVISHSYIIAQVEINPSQILLENEGDIYWKNSTNEAIPTLTVHSDNNFYLDSPNGIVFRHRPTLNNEKINFRFTSEGNVELNGRLRSSDILTHYELTEGTTSRLSLNSYDLGTYLSNAVNSSAYNVGNSWDMIRLTGINNSDFFSWSIGLVDTVEFDGDIGLFFDDYDCHDCLTMTHSTDFVNYRVKRVIDRDGHAHTFIDNEVNPTIRNPQKEQKKSNNENRTALQKLLDLRLSSPALKSQNNQSSLSFEVEELKALFPELLVSIPDEESKSYYLNYEGLIPILIRSIQEQQSEIESLKTIIHKPEND